MSIEKVKRMKGLPTITSWIIMILITIGMLLFSWVTRTSGPGKWWLVHGWWIPPIYLMILFEFLGRANPKLRPTKAQWALFMIAFYVFLGKWALFSWCGNVGYFDVVNPFFKGYGVIAAYNPVLRETYMNLNIPKWLIPLNVEEAEKVWNGLAPGQTPDWSVWVGPIVSWSLIIVSTIYIGLFLTYLFFGPQWNETERLVYAAVLPTTTLINTYETRDENDRSLLFNFTHPQMKALWVSAVIGFIVSLPFYWRATWGAPWLALGGGVGWIHLDFRPYTNAILPGANFMTRFNLYTAILCLLLPYSAIISMLLGWLIFQVIYPPLGIAAGWFPVGANYGLSYPMPWTVWLWSGFSLGLAAYFLWGMRGRFIRAFRALGGQDYAINGISMRWGLIGLGISVLVFLGVWTAAGMNIIMAILLLIFYLLFDIVAAKRFVAFSPIGAGCAPVLPMFAWPVGAATGLWSWTPPSTSTSLAVYSIASQGMGHCFSFTNSMSIGGMNYLYKTSYDTGHDMKESLIYIMVLLAVCTPILMTFSTWLDYHVGFINLNESAQNAIGGNYPGNALNYGVQSLAGYWLGSPTEFWTQTVIGAVIAIILQFLRVTFPWFPVDPLWLMISIHMDAPMLGWLTLITGLILKLVLTKSLGPRRTAEYGTSILVGLMIGMCFFYLITGADTLFRLGIPNLQMHWR